MNRLFALSIVARLPVAMLSIGLLVHTERATGAYAVAGLVAGALALAQGVGGPLLGRAIDRRGQTAVLVVAALVCAAALVATSFLPSDAPVALRVLLAVAAGASLPPVGACQRSLLASLVGPASAPARELAAREAALRSAYAADAAVVELTWVAGPPLVLAVGAAVSTGAALAAAGALLGLSTLAFAAAKPSRAWRSEPKGTNVRGALRASGMRTLAAILLGVGVVFGVVEVAVTAAADHFGSAGAAGPLLGLWGIGALIGGLAAAKLGGGARSATGLTALLVALAATHAALGLAGSPLMLGALVLLAGTTIAPTYATAYAMVDAVAPKGTATEAFAWLATATAVGTSAGAAGAGMVVDATGPSAAFVVAGLAAAVAALIAQARARTLPGTVPIPVPAS